jgi:hypothetical protein
MIKSNFTTSIQRVNIKKPPKNNYEKTMLQHTLQFLDPLEYFLSFRLVCKAWQNAVEIITLHGYKANDTDILAKYDICPQFVAKYIKLFKHLNIDPLVMPKTEIESKSLSDFILKNIKNMKTIFIKFGFQQGQEFWLRSLLKNSHKTLTKVNNCTLNSLPDNISFPKLNCIDLYVGTDIEKKKFETCFPKMLKRMKNLEHVKLRIKSNWLSKGDDIELYKYIAEHYSKHCITNDASDLKHMLNYLPFKVAAEISSLTDLDGKKYTHELEHLFIFIENLNPMSDGWDRYQDIFDQCLNLKQIALYKTSGDDHELHGNFKISDDLPNIWKNRIAYFQKRGIKIVEDENEFFENDEFELKLTKAAGVKWRFSFIYP